jgi:hypothetical protein
MCHYKGIARMLRKISSLEIQNEHDAGSTYQVCTPYSSRILKDLANASYPDSSLIPEWTSKRRVDRIRVKPKIKKGESSKQRRQMQRPRRRCRREVGSNASPARPRLRMKRPCERRNLVDVSVRIRIWSSSARLSTRHQALP